MQVDEEDNAREGSLQSQASGPVSNFDRTKSRIRQHSSQHAEPFRRVSSIERSGSAQPLGDSGIIRRGSFGRTRSAESRPEHAHTTHAVQHWGFESVGRAEQRGNTGSTSRRSPERHIASFGRTRSTVQSLSIAAEETLH